VVRMRTSTPLRLALMMSRRSLGLPGSKPSSPRRQAFTRARMHERLSHPGNESAAKRPFVRGWVGVAMMGRAGGGSACVRAWVGGWVQRTSRHVCRRDETQHAGLHACSARTYLGRK
jgi:hypothetical protein